MNRITTRYLIEGITLSIESGLKYSKARKLFESEDLISYSDFGINGIQEMCDNFIKYYFKHRLYGIIHNTGGNLKHFVMKQLITLKIISK